MNSFCAPFVIRWSKIQSSAQLVMTASIEREIKRTSAHRSVLVNLNRIRYHASNALHWNNSDSGATTNVMLSILMLIDSVRVWRLLVPVAVVKNYMELNNIKNTWKKNALA